MAPKPSFLGRYVREKRKNPTSKKWRPDLGACIGEEPSRDVQGREPERASQPAARSQRVRTGQQQQRLLQQALPPRKRGRHQDLPHLTCKTYNERWQPCLFQVISVGRSGRREPRPSELMAGGRNQRATKEADDDEASLHA